MAFFQTSAAPIFFHSLSSFISTTAFTGVYVRKVVNQYNVARHFQLAIGEAVFSFRRKADSITAEAVLDGFYVIHTAVQPKKMMTADGMRDYKSLANVEPAFRTLKTVDLKARPVHHRPAQRGVFAGRRQPGACNY